MGWAIYYRNSIFSNTLIMSNSRIYYTKPSITELEVEFATEAAKDGWGDKCYEYIELFQKKFADHHGVS